MLELVRNIRVNSVLESSLYNEAKIELGLEERPGEVTHPWGVQVQMPDKRNRTLPAGTSMEEIFQEMNGAMLILGEPGSGKSTMLLELARDCIESALQDDDLPIPIVFNLSSWGSGRSIDEWLIDELRKMYSVDKKTAREWVENDDLSLLLDGLDEVKLDNRDKCVKAINDFRQEHGIGLQLAVCCRVADYKALPTQLNLSGAILIQPLTQSQIDAYFKRAGPELRNARQFLKKDKILQELVKQPLFLNVVTLAYRGETQRSIESKGLRTLEARRKHLFDTYVTKMFERLMRTKIDSFSPTDTKRWLSWLAQKMLEHNHDPYLLENMQPEWLSQGKRWGYAAILGSIGGMVIALIIGPIVRIFWGLTNGLIAGSIGGLIGAVILLLSIRNSEIKPVDTLKWELKSGRNAISEMLPVAIISSIIMGLLVGCSLGPLKGFIVAAGMALFVLLSELVTGGVTVKSISQTLFPGQRLQLSIKNFILAFLGFGMVNSILWGVVLLRSGEKTMVWLIGGLVIGLLAGLSSGLKFGGKAIFQHYALRFIIARNDLLPWRLIPFLDYCVDRIFLHRVGGGYSFKHRLLMEHFAAMYPEENPAE